MRTYDLIQDFSPDDPEAHSVSVSADWLMAVVRVKYPMTYRRRDKASFSTFFPRATEVRGKTLIIHGGISSLQVSSTKSNHLSTLGATLLPGDVNYLSEVLPGDYLVAWMLNDEQRTKNLIERIREGKACNNFSDGIKFFGKVESLQKSLTQSPEGHRNVRYSLQGTGFSEFDATLFYNPHLQEKIPSIGRFFARITEGFNKLVGQNSKGPNYIDVNHAIPFFVDMLLGSGVPTNLGRGNSDPRLKATAGLEGDYSYIIPKEFAALIGKTKSSKDGGAFAAADVIEIQHGVQLYNQDKGMQTSVLSKEFAKSHDYDDTDIRKAAIFSCDGQDVGTRRYTGTPMLGRFLPQIPQFTNSTVWSILSQYLNSACNEMYVCLKPNGFGRVVPTLTIRQLPFSSGLGKTPFPITRFLDLPRWKVPSVIVRSVQLGRSNALRFNWIHVVGVNPNQGSSADASQTVRNPPFRDELDISRSGLRNYSAKIPCSWEDINDNINKNGHTAAQDWMTLLSDILMGQHLTLTGSMSTQGIPSPIAPGDNIEWDGVVLHIESVTHNCSITPDGKKSFLTTLTLTHGMRTSPGQDDISLYAGIRSGDQISFDPGTTNEEVDNGNVLEDAYGVDGTQEVAKTEKGHRVDAALEEGRKTSGGVMSPDQKLAIEKATK
jgi:hypothetical protein